MDKQVLVFIAVLLLIFLLARNFMSDDKTVRPAVVAGAGETLEPLSDAYREILAAEMASPANTYLVSDTQNSVNVTLTARGAALMSAELTRFKDRDDPDSPFKLLTDFMPNRRHMVLADNLGKGNRYRLNQRTWNVESADARGVVFSLVLDDPEDTSAQIKITKNYAIEENADASFHALRLDVTIETLGSHRAFFPYRLVAIDGINPDRKKDVPETSFYNDPTMAGIATDAPNGKVDFREVKPDELVKSETPGQYVEAEKNVRWAGLITRYFVAAVKPAQQIDGRNFKNDLEYVRIFSRDARDDGGDTAQGADKPSEHLALLFKTVSLKVNPSEPVTHSYRLLLDTRADMMKRDDMSGLSYTWFMTISNVLIGLLAWLQSVVVNWGLAIILLTLIVKLVLHPTVVKQQRSMHKMGKIAPELNKLKEKYKNNPREFSARQMELYKKHKVNPMMGCLPMLIQLPIFIALLRGIGYAVELRMAGFFGWVDDLSQPDVLCNLPFTVPFFGWSTLNILPLVMTATWMAQSFSMPMSPDPQQQQQQKIMRFMPLIFALMFYNAPSGLTLYWTFSTLLGIIESKYTRHRIEKEENGMK